MKKITPDNWNKHDETSSVIISINHESGAESCWTGAGWAQKFMEPTLTARVPEEVGRLFEVARGVMVYGWFFYPMYTIGSQQLYFVHDAATIHKCRIMKSPELRTFNDRIHWLTKYGCIRSDHAGRWHAARELRNAFAHADEQSIFSPDMALSNIWVASEMINELFS